MRVAAAKRTSSGLTTNNLRNAIDRLLTSGSYTEVEFMECDTPLNNPLEDDYVVTYEATLLPSDLDRAYLHLHLTNQGQVGIGLETRERIARRLDVGLRENKKGFGAGRELASITLEELMRFVELVAEGKVVLRASIGLSGLGEVRAVVRPETAASLEPSNARHWDWITISSEDFHDTQQKRTLRFEPWSQLAP